MRDFGVHTLDQEMGLQACGVRIACQKFLPRGAASIVCQPKIPLPIIKIFTKFELLLVKFFLFVHFEGFDCAFNSTFNLFFQAKRD